MPKLHWRVPCIPSIKNSAEQLLRSCGLPISHEKQVTTIPCYRLRLRLQWLRRVNCNFNRVKPPQINFPHDVLWCQRMFDYDYCHAKICSTHKLFVVHLTELKYTTLVARHDTRTMVSIDNCSFVSTALFVCSFAHEKVLTSGPRLNPPLMTACLQVSNVLWRPNQGLNLSYQTATVAHCRNFKPIPTG